MIVMWLISRIYRFAALSGHFVEGNYLHFSCYVLGCTCNSALNPFRQCDDDEDNNNNNDNGNDGDDDDGDKDNETVRQRDRE